MLLFLAVPGIEELYTTMSVPPRTGWLMEWASSHSNEISSREFVSSALGFWLSFEWFLNLNVCLGIVGNVWIHFSDAFEILVMSSSSLETSWIIEWISQLDPLNERYNLWKKFSSVGLKNQIQGLKPRLILSCLRCSIWWNILCLRSDMKTRRRFFRHEARLTKGEGIHVLVAEGFDASRHGGGRAPGYVNAPSGRSVWGWGQQHMLCGTSLTSRAQCHCRALRDQGKERSSWRRARSSRIIFHPFNWLTKNQNT